MCARSFFTFFLFFSSQKQYAHPSTSAAPSGTPPAGASPGGRGHGGGGARDTPAEPGAVAPGRVARGHGGGSGGGFRPGQAGPGQPIPSTSAHVPHPMRPTQLGGGLAASKKGTQAKGTQKGSRSRPDSLQELTEAKEPPEELL